MEIDVSPVESVDSTIEDVFASDNTEYQEIVLERLETISDSCTQIAVVSTFGVTIAFAAVIIYIAIRPIFEFWR